MGVPLAFSLCRLVSHRLEAAVAVEALGEDYMSCIHRPRGRWIHVVVEAAVDWAGLVHGSDRRSRHVWGVLVLEIMGRTVGCRVKVVGLGIPAATVCTLHSLVWHLYLQLLSGLDRATALSAFNQYRSDGGIIIA